MEKTIYLHIGLPKTGTTSIQHFLFENRIELAKHGVLYPLMDFNALPKNESLLEKFKKYMGNTMNQKELEYFIRKSQVLNEKVNLRLFFSQDFDYTKFFSPYFLKETPETHASYKKGFEACFLKEIVQSNLQNIILSEEAMSQYISTLPIFIEVLQNFGFKVKIISYVRKAVDWLVALWKQRVRISMTQKDLKFYCEASCDFMALNKVYYLIQLLGKENVIIRPYEKVQWKNNNLIDDFLDIFNIDASKSAFEKKENQNVSPSRNTIEIIRILNFSGVLKLNDQNPIREKLVAISPPEDEDLSNLGDVENFDITKRTRHLYTRLANIYGKENFFINEFPSCYGKERSVFDTVTINEEQQEIVLEAFNNNRQEKDKQLKELEEENTKLRQQLENKKA